MKRILSIAALLLIANAGMAHCITVEVVCKDPKKPDLSAEVCGNTTRELLDKAIELANLVDCKNEERQEEPVQ